MVRGCTDRVYEDKDQIVQFLEVEIMTENGVRNLMTKENQNNKRKSPRKWVKEQSTA